MMDTYAYFWTELIKAIRPCWAELVGAFLMATMINLFSAKGNQKSSFSFFSLAFYILILRDLMAVFFSMAPTVWPTFRFTETTPMYMSLVLTAMITTLFIIGAFKNLKIYFSSFSLFIILTAVFAGVSFLPSHYYFSLLIKTYLPPLYLTLSFFIAGGSFYLNKNTRQNKAIRAVGNGFFVLFVCYSYQVFGLLENIQQVLFLCYTVAVVLALASQVQYLNLYGRQLLERLENEERGKQEIWEFSPFPIMISRLRDDEVLYMNPAAAELLLVSPGEETKFKLSDYFVSPEKKDELLEIIRKNQVAQSFEVLVHHPKKNNELWISMTTKTTDMNEEIVLFTTFQDVTEQKKMAQVLEKQASTDPLTGLFNRRQFEILAHQALQSARRYNMSYSVGMLDIDFFKKVNDTYGHEVGDQVLKNLAKTLKDTLRRSDVIARYGGEEFIVFFTQTSPEEASVAADHILEAVRSMETKVDGQNIPITVSIGISDGRTTNLSVLVKQADDALYHSKKNGRDQSTLYQDLRNHFTEDDYVAMRRKKTDSNTPDSTEEDT